MRIVVIVGDSHTVGAMGITAYDALTASPIKNVAQFGRVGMRTGSYITGQVTSSPYSCSHKCVNMCVNMI